MFYFFLIVVVIGLSFWLELKKEVNHEVDDDDVEPLNPQSYKENKRVAGKGYVQPRRRVLSQENEDFQKAREFVEQLKQRQRNENSKEKSDIEFERKNVVKKSNQYTSSSNKNVGRNYIDKASVRKSIEQMERETAEIQARAMQALQEIEQMNVDVRESIDRKSDDVQQSYIGKYAFFKDNNDLRRAFVASEILSKPLSLRK